jgi:prepilin-type N-terminal cleavage/methylation domain-containing protein
MNKNNGFTLVELLAVIVILAVILVIAIPNVMKVIDKAKLDAYKRNEDLLVNATRNYLAGNSSRAPINIGDISIIDLTELQSNNIIGNIKDTKGNGNCVGQVTVTKKSINEYTYGPYMECSTNYKTSEYIKDGLVLYLDGFDAPVGSVWKDRSGNNNDATMVGFDGTSGYDINKKAYVFDGTNDTMTSTMQVGDNFTVQVVVQLTKLNFYNGLISLQNNLSKSFALGPHFSNKLLYFGNSTWVAPWPTGNLATRQLHTYVYKKSDYFSLYTNITKSTTATYMGGLTYGNENIIIGNCTWGYLQGNLYSIRIYNRELSAAEVESNYNIDKLKFGL